MDFTLHKFAWKVKKKTTVNLVHYLQAKACQLTLCIQREYWVKYTTFPRSLKNVSFLQAPRHKYICRPGGKTLFTIILVITRTFLTLLSLFSLGRTYHHQFDCRVVTTHKGHVCGCVGKKSFLSRGGYIPCIVYNNESATGYIGSLVSV